MAAMAASDLAVQSRYDNETKYATKYTIKYTIKDIDFIQVLNTYNKATVVIQPPLFIQRREESEWGIQGTQMGT